MVDAVWPEPGCRQSPPPLGIASDPAAGVGGSGTLPRPKSWVLWRRRPLGPGLAGPALGSLAGPVGDVQAPSSSSHSWQFHAGPRAFTGNTAAWSPSPPLKRGRVLSARS